MEGVWISSREISTVLAESNVSSREMQITSSTYGDSGMSVLVLTGAGGGTDVEVEAMPSWERRVVRYVLL